MERLRAFSTLARHLLFELRKENASRAWAHGIARAVKGTTQFLQAIAESFPQEFQEFTVPETSNRRVKGLASKDRKVFVTIYPRTPNWSSEHVYIVHLGNHSLTNQYRIVVF